MRVGEILENGAESMKPVDVEDHVVAYQGNDKEFQDEFLPGNAEFDVLANVVAAVSSETKEWVESKSTKAVMTTS
jgi:hypothetical protein